VAAAGGEDPADEDWEEGCAAVPACATLTRRAATSNSKIATQPKNESLRKMLGVTVPII
jgi:hypothetical protein